MKIDIREVTRVLDANLKKYENGQKVANLYFLCRHDLNLDGLIRDWLEKNELNTIQNMLPQVLWQQNPQGILEKTYPPVYVLGNDFQKRMEKPFVFYYKMFNYGRDFNGDDMIIDLLSKDTAPNASFEPIDLKNRMFTVAYGFTKDSGNRISDLPKGLIDLFEVYEVQEDLQYMLEDKYQSLMTFADAVKEDDEKLAKEDYLHASFVKKLLDTGYNIPDCGIYMNNHLDEAFRFGKNNTFELYKAALIEALELDVKSGVFVVSEKAKEDVPKMIEWIKGIQ